jgi:membrane fusion protein (multidrug efflux system)
MPKKFKQTLVLLLAALWSQAHAADKPIFQAPVPAPVPNLAPLVVTSGGVPASAALVAKPQSSEPRRSGDFMDCLLEPSLVANVGTPVEGTLNEVMVDRGSEVRKGQVVARLNAAVEAATVTLRQAQEAYGQRKVARNEELFRQDLISASDKDELETQTRLAGLELKQQQEVLNLRTILSPLTGVVVERYLAPGDRVSQEKILKLAQIDPLNVEVVVPVHMFGSIKLGMDGQIRLSPLLSGNYTAKVVVVDRVVDAASGTFGVRLQLPNPGYKIPAGIRCGVRFNR